MGDTPRESQDHAFVDMDQALSPWCLDHEISIAWDQWARVRISCVHGTAEGVSGGLSLNQAFARACQSWRAMPHESQLCWAEQPVPEDYPEDDDFWWDYATECQLSAGHEGEHRRFDHEWQRNDFLYDGLKYYRNGIDCTDACSSVPHPYAAGRKERLKREAAES